MTPDDQSPRTILDQLDGASECGLQTLTTEILCSLDEVFCQTAGISELVQAVTLMVRIAASHLPGLPLDPADAAPPIVPVYQLPAAVVTPDQLLRACLDRLDGLRGSSSIDDVICVADLIDWFSGDLFHVYQSASQSGDDVNTLRQFLTWCHRTLRQGSDRMRGAAAGALCAVDAMNSRSLGQLLIGWLDGATDREGRSRLRDGLSGAAQVLLSQMQNDPQWLDDFETAMNGIADGEFLSRLPALRGAFDPFSPADRKRLLQLRLQGLDQRGSSIDREQWDEPDDNDAVVLHVARLRQADLAGRAAVMDAFPELERYLRQSDAGGEADRQTDAPSGSSPSSVQTDNAVSAADRWRLVFGLPPKTSRQMFRWPRSRSINFLARGAAKDHAATSNNVAVEAARNRRNRRRRSGPMTWKHSLAAMSVKKCSGKLLAVEIQPSSDTWMSNRSRHRSICCNKFSR